MKLKIKVGEGAPPYAGMEEGEKKEIGHVCIEKLKNGYLICPMGEGSEAKEFVRNLKDSPSLLAKLFGVDNKNADEMKKDMEYEED